MPTGTVLFITRIGAPRSCGRSSITDQTAERLASPDAVGGVPTADEQELGAGDRLFHREREGQALPVPGEQLVEPRLEERHLPGAQRIDPLGDDVADDDVVAELGEAGPADEAGVPGAEECDPCHRRRRLALGPERS